ncbi:MAG: aromatic aminobenezylarsenical efflux permease ArsG family transporter [Luteibaculaceae bacterium]
MDWINQLAQETQWPILAAFLIGLLTAVSPCPLATNITATAFISKEVKNKSTVLKMGLLYTLGRAFSYITIALLLFFGASKFHVARFFQTKGEFLIAPILIIIGLMMLNIIRLNFLNGKINTSSLAEKFKNKGLLGAFALGVIFSLAFCPYSGALYFGILIPLSIAKASALYLPIVFAIGTGLPVILFSFLLAYAAGSIGSFFNTITKVELAMRKIAGAAFLVTGIYYAYIFYI